MKETSDNNGRYYYLKYFCELVFNPTLSIYVMEGSEFELRIVLKGCINLGNKSVVCL